MGRFPAFRDTPHARPTHQRSPAEVVYENQSDKLDARGGRRRVNQYRERLPDPGRSAAPVPKEASPRAAPAGSAGRVLRHRGRANANRGAATAAGGDLRGTAAAVSAAGGRGSSHAGAADTGLAGSAWRRA